MERGVTAAGLTIRTATLDDHPVLQVMSRQSKYTHDFRTTWTSGPACYASGRIRVAVAGGGLVGFTAFYRRKAGLVSLYFVCVDKDQRGKGIGTALMKDLLELSGGDLELKVHKENRSVGLYERLGLRIIGEAYGGKAWLMRSYKPVSLFDP